MLFVRFLQILILWWIISLLYKWWRGNPTTGTRQQKPSPDNDSTDSDIIHSGSIEDADFEEID